MTMEGQISIKLFPTDQAIVGTRMYASLYAGAKLWINYSL